MKKLFWQDPYMKECDATVTKVAENKVELDKSILFAFSGGQASDQGTINEIPVIEVQDLPDTIIYTLESAPAFSEGDSVHVTLDWDYRYKIMRLHTAAHIVYEIFKELTGHKKLIGSNISADKARIDYEIEENVSDYFGQITEKVEDLVNQNLEVKTYDDPENPGRRWWEIPNVCKMPCGGTHIKSTGEIGKISLKRKNLGAGKERIEIKFAD